MPELCYLCPPVPPLFHLLPSHKFSYKRYIGSKINFPIISLFLYLLFSFLYNRKKINIHVSISFSLILIFTSCFFHFPNLYFPSNFPIQDIQFQSLLPFPHLILSHSFSFFSFSSTKASKSRICLSSSSQLPLNISTFCKTQEIQLTSSVCWNIICSRH